ncbi:vitamin B12 dependent-methionine synthase activation domain-containing protein [Chloroflexota bacterium]
MLAIKNQLDIDMQQVLHNIGYDADCEPAARIMSLVDEYVENAYSLIEPSYSCVIRDIKMVQGACVIIDGPILLRSQVVARVLEQCHKAAVFLVTIGNHLEEMACRLAEDGLILQAAVLDAIGSVAAESVANIVQDKVGEIASDQGLVISRRFSPGYCDWGISQQKIVFQAVDGDAVGIRLTERCLMIPRKSISGIIGIGHSNGNVENYNPCKTCNKYDCLNRR